MNSKKIVLHNQEIVTEETKNANVLLFVKREDLIHPFISGNKFRKLKYNIAEAKKLNYNTLLTFGGAYSNHIAATAYAGFENNLKTIGIIRGKELSDKIEENPTLSFAKKHGMNFEFVSRVDYRKKNEAGFIESLKNINHNSYIIPEGGTNELAVKGCEEILEKEDFDFDFICTAVGTGGTISGLINCSQLRQQIIGFPALKGDFLQTEIRKFALQVNWSLQTNYHFGGYAKVDKQLVNFINSFKEKTNIPLDPVYTGKMLFGILDMIKKGYFKKNTKILAIHTGGLQGISGMNARLKQKKLPLIK